MAEPLQQVFPIGAAGGSAAEMGFKAYNLARMARLGLPVPAGFALGIALCRAWLAEPEAAMAAGRPAISAAMHDLERSSGLHFGDARRPLLVSVRSGAPVSMPGMMDTLLDIGLNRTTLRGLLRLTGNPRLAWDSYRRLIQNFAETVYGADPVPFREALERTLAGAGLAHPRDLDFRCLAALADEFLALHEELAGKPFPQDPQVQLERAIAAVFRSWESDRARTYRSLHGLADDLGTAVTIQRMVFGNAGGTSGAGVAFTRDPSTGENRLYVDFLFNSQGEDVVSGRHRAEDAGRLARVLPAAWRELGAARIMLEREFADAQELEFTIQEGKLFLLQTRTAKRTPWAALRIAVEQVREGLIDRKLAQERLSKLDPAAIVRKKLAGDESGEALAQAVCAGAGVVSGRIALDYDAVRRCVDERANAILVRDDISTGDIAAISLATGVLSIRGTRTAHAAVVARQLGKACLVGCDALAIDLAQRSVRLAGRLLREGETISLDANEGRIYAGEMRVVEERPEEWLADIERWKEQELTTAA